MDVREPHKHSSILPPWLRAKMPVVQQPGQPMMVPNAASLMNTLANIWRQALGAETIQPADDFFNLGGNSRLAIEIVSRVRDACNVEIPLAFLFKAPTFGEFHRVVAA